MGLLFAEPEFVQKLSGEEASIFSWGALGIHATGGAQSYLRRRGHEDVPRVAYAVKVHLLYMWHMKIDLARLIMSPPIEPLCYLESGEKHTF